MARKIIFFFLLSTSLLLPSECRKKAKFVTTLIDAKWHETPLVLEISEFFAEENNNLFWSFVDDIVNLEPAFWRLGNKFSNYTDLFCISGLYCNTSLQRTTKFDMTPLSVLPLSIYRMRK